MVLHSTYGTSWPGPSIPFIGNEVQLESSSGHLVKILFVQS